MSASPKNGLELPDSKCFVYDFQKHTHGLNADPRTSRNRSVQTTFVLKLGRSCPRKKKNEIAAWTNVNAKLQAARPNIIHEGAADDKDYFNVIADAHLVPVMPCFLGQTRGDDLQRANF